MTDLNVTQAGYDLTQWFAALIELLDIMTVLWELIKEILLHDNNMPYDISITEGIFLKLIEMASENMIYASYSVQEEEWHQIIKEHINWYSNAAEAGFIAVTRPSVSRVLSNLSEQEIISLAEYTHITLRKGIHNKISIWLFRILDKNIWVFL